MVEIVLFLLFGAIFVWNLFLLNVYVYVCLIVFLCLCF